MGQVPTMVKTHTHYGVTHLKQSHIYSRVRLRSGVRLNVRVFRPKKLFDPINGELLNNIHMGVTTVVSAPWIALAVLIRENTASSSHNGGGGKIFRRYELEAHSLPFFFLFDKALYLQIGTYLPHRMRFVHGGAFHLLDSRLFTACP